MIPDSERWWWYNPEPSNPYQDPFPVWVRKVDRHYEYKINGKYFPVRTAPGMWKGIVVKYKGGRV